MMNCIFDCEYCYLKGMYPSGNLVVFVNLEDIFAELEALLSQKSIYLCVSYDADLVAIESLTGFVREWIAFTKKHENLTIEIRTKSGRCDLLSNYEACDRVIIAYTVSPQGLQQSMSILRPHLWSGFRQQNVLWIVDFQCDCALIR